MDTKNARLLGSTRGWNQVAPDPKKGSKWFKKLCANQVLYGGKAGFKKDFTGFYLGFMWDLKLFRIYGLKRVLSRSCPDLRSGLYVYTEPNIVKLGPFRNAERTWPICRSISPLWLVQTLLDAHTFKSRDPC